MTFPLIVIRPIEFALANQRSPPGPVVMLNGESDPFAGVVGTVPLVVIRPIELLALFVNQRAPSGPVVIHVGIVDAGPV